MLQEGGSLVPLCWAVAPYNASASCPSYAIFQRVRYSYAGQAGELSQEAPGDAQCLAFCTAVPCYTFTAGKDSAGADIVDRPYDTATARQLAALCDRTDGCVGFNSLGWLKEAIKSQLDPWPKPAPRPCDGLFVKHSAWG